jgi:hypothetical protein
VVNPVRVVACEGIATVPRRRSVDPRRRVYRFFSKKLAIEFFAAIKVDLEELGISEVKWKEQFRHFTCNNATGVAETPGTGAAQHFLVTIATRDT